MWMVSGVFVGVVAIVLGLYWLFVVRPEQPLLDRLAPQGHRTKALKGVLKPEERMSSLDPIQALLERAGPLVVPVRALLVQSGLQINVSTFLLMSLVAMMFVYLMLSSLSGLQWLGVLGGVVAGMTPLLVVRRIREQRLLRFEEQFPEAIDLVARALRAGHALTTGLGMVANELSPPVGTEFRMVFDEQNYGLSLADAMRNLGARVPVLDARFFVTAVLTQRESGGNLAEVLDNLSAVTRERFRVKRQVRVISAHGRITGLVLAMLPPVLAIVISIVNPEYLGEMLRDPIGIRMVLTAVVLQVIGTVAIRRIVRIEY